MSYDWLYFLPTVISSTDCAQSLPLQLVNYLKAKQSKATVKKLKYVNRLVQISQPFRQQIIIVIYMFVNLVLVPTKTIAQGHGLSLLILCTWSKEHSWDYIQKK